MTSQQNIFYVQALYPQFQILLDFTAEPRCLASQVFLEMEDAEPPSAGEAGQAFAAANGDRSTTAAPGDHLAAAAVYNCIV